MKIERRAYPYNGCYVAIAELFTDDGKVIRRPGSTPDKPASYLVVARRRTEQEAKERCEKDIPFVIREAERDGVI